MKMNSNSNGINRIVKELRPYAIWVLLSMMCAGVTVYCTLVIPVCIGDAVDVMVGVGGVDFGALGQIFRKMMVAIIGEVASNYAMNLINNHVAYSVTREIRNRAFGRILRMPLKRLDMVSHGDYVSRVITDADNFSDGLLLGFSNGFTAVLTIIGTVVFMLRIHLGIGLIVVALTPLSLLLAKFIAEKSKKWFAAQAADRGAVTEHLSEAIEQQKLVRQLNFVEEDGKHFDEKNETLKNSALKATFYSSITNPGTRFVNSLIYGAVTVAGALLAIGGSISVGQLTAFLGYAREYSKPFNDITGVITEMQNAVVCGNRLFEIIDAEVEEAGGDSASSQMRRGSLVSEIPVERRRIPRGGSISFEDVSFSYVSDRPLMQHIDLSVDSGQKVAIVGPTGAGKTTLINLLMRFYDVDEGSIKIDGMDIRQMPRNMLREKFGMVLQETWLKEATIFENISMAMEGASIEQVKEAARLSHADDFIRKMKDGYDTKLTGEGKNLSAGQRQLLCITRLMLNPPPMLILDEATSSIDTRTEMLIQANFARLMKGRTTFIVAHRLSTIRDADVILYMENGNILEQGRHEELLTAGGKYAALYKAQYE